jgi:hypothetical protein
VGTIIITDGHGPSSQLTSGNIGSLGKDSGSFTDSEDDDIAADTNTSYLGLPQNEFGIA